MNNARKHKDQHPAEAPVACKCTLRERLVGDGCSVCNPALALDYARETIADLEATIARVRALADRWTQLAGDHGPRQFTGNDHAIFANELRAVLEGSNG